MFARVFRKHLEGGFIENIRQIGNDRRVEIDIKVKMKSATQCIVQLY